MISLDYWKWKEEMLEQETKFFHEVMTNHAVPPMKGVLTIGKMKWRGIHICRSSNYSTYKETVWLEQRGKKIGGELIHNLL